MQNPLYAFYFTAYPPPICQAVGTNFSVDFDIFLLFSLDLLFFIAAVLHKHKKRKDTSCVFYSSFKDAITIIFDYLQISMELTPMRISVVL